MNSVPKLFSCCYADCWTENHFSTEFGVLTPNRTHSHTLFWGCVSRWFGRALAWHARGHRFDPGILHHQNTVDFQVEINGVFVFISKQVHRFIRCTRVEPPELPAFWQKGRRDYQILYAASGKAHFWFISTNWFIRNFKQYMKISPAQYILSLRMVNAQSLLENTDYTIGEIAEIVGCENPLYFSRVFKKAYGVSPAQYRKKPEELQDQWSSGQTISSICSNTSSICRTSVNWVRARSRL